MSFSAATKNTEQPLKERHDEDDGNGFGEDDDDDVGDDG